MNAIRRHPWITLAVSLAVVFLLWTLFFVVLAEGSGDAGLGPLPG
jgi:hypothetical protein